MKKYKIILGLTLFGMVLPFASQAATLFNFTNVDHMETIPYGGTPYPFNAVFQLGKPLASPSTSTFYVIFPTSTYNGLSGFNSHSGGSDSCGGTAVLQGSFYAFTDSGYTSWDNGSSTIVGTLSGSTSTVYAPVSGESINPNEWYEFVFTCGGGQNINATSVASVAFNGSWTGSTWAPGQNAYTAPLTMCVTESPSLDCSGIPSIPTFTGSFKFPTTTYEGPDFSNWALKLNFPATSTIYHGVIAYQNSNGFNNNVNTYQDYFSVNSGNATSVLWTVPKSKSLFAYQNNNGTTSVWTAELYDIDAGPAPSSSESIFTITPFATSTPVQDGANLAGPFYYNAVQTVPSFSPQSLASSSAVLASQCQPASDILDWGHGLSYAFCTAINYLFVADPNTIDSLNNTLTNLKGTFPFSYIFGIQSGFIAESNSTGSTVGITISDWPNPDGTTSTVAMQDLGQVPQTDNFGRLLFQARQAWFNFCIYLFIALLILIAIVVMHHQVKKS